MGSRQQRPRPRLLWFSIGEIRERKYSKKTKREEKKTFKPTETHKISFQCVEHINALRLLPLVTLIALWKCLSRRPREYFFFFVYFVIVSCVLACHYLAMSLIYDNQIQKSKDVKFMRRRRSGYYVTLSRENTIQLCLGLVWSSWNYLRTISKQCFWLVNHMEM